MSGRQHFALEAIVDRWQFDNHRILADKIQQFRSRHNRVRAKYNVVPDWYPGLVYTEVDFSESWYHKWYLKTLALWVFLDLLQLRNQRRWRTSLALSFTSLQAETKEISYTSE